MVFFSDCFFWYRASYNTESRLLLLDQSVCFYSVFSVVREGGNQWKLEVKIRNLPEVSETRVTKLWLVLVLNVGANFLDRSKREVKQEQIIFGESYTFKTICSWWWSTTINFYNGFLLFLPFSWSMSTPHSSKWWGSRHRKRWRR